MAAVRLEFAQFGHFDYFNIYRNLASTNIEDLGQPIGTSSTMYYVDSTVEPSLSYFYRVGVVRDLVEQFSAEINVIADVVFTPPYNLTVEFKNDGVDCLELNWSLDGVVDEQRYYCSETPIDSENLPVPKSVLAGNIRAYTDFAITEGSEYYICVGSVRNGVEKLSDIAIVTASMPDEYWANVTSLLHFNGPNNSTTFTDEKGTSWYKDGSPVISTTQSKFGGSSGRFSNNNYISTNTMAPFLFSATEDFTIEFWLYVPTSATLKDNLLPIICAGFQDVSSMGGGWNLALIDNANAVMNLQTCKTNGTVQNADFATGAALARDVWHHIEFGRAAGTTYGFFNGNLKGTTTTQNNIPFDSPNTSNVSIGSGNGRVLPNNWHMDGYIDDLRVTKGVCRHTVGFTPPNREAPNF